MSACAVLHLTPVQGGGADRHVRDLAASGERAHLIWHAADRADAIESPDGSIRALDLRAIAKNRAGFARWLAAQRVGLVHLHSVHTPVRLRAAWAARALGVPTMVTLHDILFQRRDAFEVGSAPGPDPAWLALTSPCLANAAAVLAPSRFIAEAAQRAIPGLEVAVIPNGRSDSTAATAIPHAEFRAKHTGRVIAVVGAVGPHKGSALVRQLATHLEGTDLAVVVIGYLDGEFAPGWRSDRLFIHGPYEDDDAVALLKAYDASIALFPNPIPESFSYALSAVWAAGIPALVTPAGALAERVTRHGGGWLLPQGFGVEEVARELRRILASEGGGDLATVKSRLQQPDPERVPTTESMRQSVEDLYRRYGVDPRAPVDPESAPVQEFLARQLHSELFRTDLAMLATDAARAQAALRAEESRSRALEAENSALRPRARAFDRLPAFLRRIFLGKGPDA